MQEAAKRGVGGWLATLAVGMGGGGGGRATVGVGWGGGASVGWSAEGAVVCVWTSGWNEINIFRC